MNDVLVDSPGIYRLHNGTLVYVKLNSIHFNLCGPGRTSRYEGTSGNTYWWNCSRRDNAFDLYSRGSNWNIKSKYRIDPRRPVISEDHAVKYFHIEPWWFR
jgi:hypothetical protein